MDKGLAKQFIWHVEKGLIDAQPGSSGVAVLNRLVDALKALPAPVGRPRSHKDKIISLMHQRHKQGASWDDITAECAELSQMHGEAVLSQKRLQNMYSDAKPAIEFAELLNS